MAADAIEKIFPDYFDRFSLPEGAKEQELTVYRACRSGACDRASFILSFEEKALQYAQGEDESDPGLYTLSTFEKPKDVRRFAATSNVYHPPYKIAVGTTSPRHGPCQRTRERKAKAKSHVDWWLYRDAFLQRSEDRFCLLERGAECTVTVNGPEWQEDSRDIPSPGVYLDGEEGEFDEELAYFEKRKNHIYSGAFSLTGLRFQAEFSSALPDTDCIVLPPLNINNMMQTN